jgi:hypothetical protein
MRFHSTILSSIIMLFLIEMLVPMQVWSITFNFSQIGMITHTKKYSCQSGSYVNINASLLTSNGT